jgi:phytoene dehydrogenase-like protein
MSKPGAYEYDAVIAGAGPNGLSAAITLAQAGCKTLIIEAKDTIGGGTRTAEVTLPGFRHDICSAIHPLGVESPFLRTLPLADYGLMWVKPPLAFGHPLDDGTAVWLEQSVQGTAEQLGDDAAAYKRFMGPLVNDWGKIEKAVLGPLPISTHLLALSRFGLLALQPAQTLAKLLFKGERARALIAGLGGHAIQPLEHVLTSGFAIVEGILGHLTGWPLARGGSQAIADAMGAYFQSLGGEIICGRPVKLLKELPPARVVLLDITPRQLLEMAGEELPPGYRRRLEGYRHGPGVFKIDYAMSEPIPWKAPELAQTATVHVGGRLEEIAAAERAVWRGEHPQKPFVLLAQQSPFDASRAPEGKHTAWAYCHVPNGSNVDMTEAIEGQIERFAPGFRDCILKRSTHNTVEMQRYNANYIGGDINGGVQDWRQTWTRPVLSLTPYATPLQGVYLCSSSTPPGGGVHGMCGHYAARAALKTLS